MDLIRQLRLALALFTAVLGVGVIGYVVIEGWSFKDAIYMTVITVTTVGFREVQPLSTPGQYFTIFLVLAGVGTAFYLLVSMSEFMIEGHLTGLLTERRVEREIRKLENHYILCGYGRVGETIAEEFASVSERFVIIENNPERVQECRNRGYLCIEGDASSDEVLQAAGIEKARGLVAAVDSDADNVFVTLTARVLNPGISIVARSILEESREKLLRAGANKVVSPSLIGGRRMAAMLLKPLVSNYLDVCMLGDDLEFRLEELRVGENSPAKGATLGEANIRKRTGALILAIKKKTGGFNTATANDTVLEEDDELVVLGTQEQLNAVQKII
ncbi:MAG: potassium channel protein [Actinobacteria bacterium]|nr:potassium channel protein [Actinomycetota bacterium]